MKILIIKLGALGDAIISTSVVNQIIKHHPNDELYLLTTPAFNDLFSHFDKLKVVAFQRKGIINIIKTILWIRKQMFSRIYDLQSNDRTSIFCALSGVSYRAGNHPRFPYNKHPTEPYIGQCHSFDRLNQIIQSANIKPATAAPYLPVPAVISEAVASWMNKHKLSNHSFVLLHAGSSPLHKDKRWPYFQELALRLRETLKIVWVGGSDDVELNNNLSKLVGIDATNTFDIRALVELGKHAKFAVTNDSAPMHILSCSQIPVLGLFGPTYPRRTHALGQFHNVISPNNIIAENDRSFEPTDISNISLDMVLNKLTEQKLI